MERTAKQTYQRYKCVSFEYKTHQNFLKRYELAADNLAAQIPIFLREFNYQVFVLHSVFNEGVN